MKTIRFPLPLAVFSIASAGFLFSMFYRASVTVLSEDLVRDLALDPNDLGRLSAAFFYAFSFSQIPLGPALDRLGARRTMTVLGLTAVAGSLVFATAHGGQQAFWGRALLGLGMAGNLMGAMMLIACWFPADRFATLTGMLTSLGAVGLIAAATPLALLSRLIGWRGVFYLAAVLNLIQVLLIWFVVRDRPSGAPAPPRTRSALASLGGLARQRFYWLISAGTFARFGAYMAVQALWAGPFLLQGLGYDQIETGNALFAMSVGYIVGQPLAGRVSDWLGRRRPVALFSLCSLALLLVGFCFWPAGTPTIMADALFFLFGAASGPGQIMYAHIKELLPRDMTGVGLTGINFFNMLGPAVLLQFAGMFAPDLSGNAGPGAFAPVWLMLAAVLGIAAVGYCLTPESSLQSLGSESPSGEKS